MVRFYRRRYRRFTTRRTTRFPYRRIGRRRNFRIALRSRKRYLRPRSVRPRMRPMITYDRTPNFPGDATVVQLKEVVYGSLSRTTVSPNNWFTGTFFPGSHFVDTAVPDVTQYTLKYRYMKVVKTTLVVQFFNKGPDMKDVGILALPTNTDVVTELPTWSAAVLPTEQPRAAWTTLGSNQSSKSVRRVVAVGTHKSAEGDSVTITGGDTRINVETGDIADPPTAPWYFWIFQGNGIGAAGNNESSSENVQYKATAYRVCKFFERRPQSA